MLHPLKVAVLNNGPFLNNAAAAAHATASLVLVRPPLADHRRRGGRGVVRPHSSTLTDAGFGWHEGRGWRWQWQKGWQRTEPSFGPRRCYSCRFLRFRRWFGSAARINLRKVQDLHPELGELRFVSKLGRGGFGSVTLVRQKTTGLLYSVKVSKPGSRLDRNCKPRDLALEDRVALRHPFIVRMLKSFNVEGMKISLFDFVRGPELRHLLDSVPKFIKERAPFYLSQIVLALEYLSNRGVVHRDLKPENILMCESGYLKIADFGLAVSHHFEDQTNSSLPGKQEFAGTVSYSSPEMILNGDDSVTDWWALGVIVHEMILGYHPFQSKRETPTAEVIMHVVAGPTLSFPSDIELGAKELILGLLDPNVEKRKEFISRIKDCEFFRSIDWSDIEKRRIKAPVVDLSILQEWKDKFILERTKGTVDTRGKKNAYRKPVFNERQRTLDNKSAQEMDKGMLWG